MTVRFVRSSASVDHDEGRYVPDPEVEALKAEIVRIQRESEFHKNLIKVLAMRLEATQKWLSARFPPEPIPRDLEALLKRHEP